ncbi:MAG: PKD domain-containing protein, partial [Bacteroidia bacterium]
MIETLQLQNNPDNNNYSNITEKWLVRPFLLLFFLWFSLPLNAQTPACCPDFELKDMVNICPPEGACDDEHSDPQGDKRTFAACKESLHTYTVYPNEAIYTYEWTVVGGTPASFTGNPIEIQWGSGTTGYITVAITGTNGCEDVITREICLVDSPTANFSFQPDPVCVNTLVNFTNLSIGGADYFWEFGDGNTSTLFSPVHSYDQPGSYEVTLTVTDVSGGHEGEDGNACGCSDSITLIVEVLEGEGPMIESDCCDGTVCPGEISSFFSNTDCTDFVWTVTGGTIISGQGTSMIEVEWDATYSVPTTVSLETPNCNNAPCPGITTIHVPVLYPNLPISGPVNLCQGNSGTFYLPSLPGTYYDWTVTGGGYTINNYDQNTNAVNITFTTPGTFIIESEYDNPLAGCSGNSTVTVEVKPILRIFGEDAVCEGSTEMYLANGDISNWTVTPSGPAINVLLPFVSEITWDDAGTYLITAQATDPTQFCNASAIQQVEVLAPPQLDPIDGPTIACPDTYLTYFISSDTEGSSFVWSIEPAGSGTIFSEMGVDKDSVVVAFNGPGPWTIEVYQEIEVSPGVTCISDLETLTVESFPPPVIVSQSGNNLVCVDAVEVFTVTSPVPQGVYEWTITPANRGTIVSGQGTDEVEIRWHGPPANATISVSSCGGSDQMAIEIVDPPLIDWIFPDGPTLYCLPDTPNNLTLSTSFDPNFTYQWYLDGVPIPGETGHEYTISSLPPVPQAYLYEVIASNGVCTKTRERIVLVSDCDGDPPPPIQCALDFSFNPDPACVGEPVSFNATSTPSNFDFAWEFGDNSTSFTQNTEKAFNAPGIYDVTLTGTWFDVCSLVVVKQVEVNPLPTCDIIATDTIFCPGDSLLLEASCHGMAAYQWYRQGELIQGADQPTYWVTTHGEYTLEVTNQFGCSSISDGVFIFTHGIPRAKISGDQSVCVNAGWFFGMVLSTPYDPDYSYEWSSSLPGVTFSPNNGNNAASTNAFFQFPTPLPSQIEFYVTVTDLTTGCINSDTLCVTVNQIPNVTIPWQTDCEGTELTLTPSPIDTSQYHYLWSNGETTPEITVSAAGFYSLLVTDKITGCAANFSAALLFPKPDLSLFPTGCETLMVNEVLDLYVPLPLNSSSWANTYPQAYPTIEWYDTDNNLLGTGQSFQFSSSTPGYFEVYVVVENSFGCSETSVVFCITVEGETDPEPGISVIKTLDNINGTDQTAFTQVGDVLTFTIVVTNTGNVPLTNVVVDDPVTGDSWTIPILQPGDSMTFTTTYTITQGDLDSCTIRNIVTATGDDPDGNQVDDMDVISVPCDPTVQDPDISVTKTLANINGTDMTEFTQVGDVLTYTIEVCNTGNVTLFNVVVNDPLTGFNQTITQLDPGDCQSFSTSYTVTQDDLDAGFVLNTVTATGEDDDGNTVTDEDEETVPGTGNPDISVTKTLANINGTDMT